MSVKKNIIANYLGNAWVALMGFAFVPIYIKYLGPEAYGLVGLFVVLQGIIAILDAGLSPTLNREMAKFKAGKHTAYTIGNLLRTVEVIYFAIAIVIATVVFFASSFIATDWLKIENLNLQIVVQSIELIGFIMAVRWMGILYRSAIMGIQYHVWLNSVTAVLATIRGIGVLGILAYVSIDIRIFFLFQLCIAILEVIILFLKTKSVIQKPHKKPHFSIKSLYTVWHFAAGMTGITILATILTQGDKLILSKLLPLEQFGYFMVAVSVTSILSMLIGPLSNVAFPRFTELITSQQKEKFNDEYHKFSQLMTIMIIPFMLVLSLFSNKIIFLWSHNHNLTNTIAPIVSIWIIGTAINGIMHIPYLAMLAYGWTRLTLLTNLVAIIIIIPAFIYFVPKYGVMAAAWIWVFINIGYLVFTIMMMHKNILTNEKWKWYIYDLLIPTLFPLIITIFAKLYADYLNISNQYFLFSYILIVGLISFSSAVLSTSIGQKYTQNLYYRYFDEKNK